METNFPICAAQLSNDEPNGVVAVGLKGNWQGWCRETGHSRLRGKLSGWQASEQRCGIKGRRRMVPPPPTSCPPFTAAEVGESAGEEGGKGGKIARGPNSELRHSMKSALRTVLAVVAGMALAYAMVVAVELFSTIVHPFPADFDGNIAEHVKRYPNWVLAVVVVAYGATAAAATWVASRIGNRLAGTVVALLLACALIFNLAMLPYTMWFKVVMLAVFLIACLLGLRQRQGDSVEPEMRVLSR